MYNKSAGKVIHFEKHNSVGMAIVLNIEFGVRFLDKAIRLSIVKIVFMTVGIYAIFDNVSNDCLYVGQSKNCESRLLSHIKSLKNGRHRQKSFVEWFKVNGIEKMSFTILEECSNNDDEKNLLEIKWFNELDPLFFGKIPSINEKWCLTEESKKKISFSVQKLNDNSLMKRDLFCQLCGKSFHSKRRTAKFCSHSCFYRFQKLKKIPPKDELFSLYCEKGRNLKELGSIFGVSSTTVFHWMDEYGIPRRGRGPKN